MPHTHLDERLHSQRLTVSHLIPGKFIIYILIHLKTGSRGIYKNEVPTPSRNSNKL